MPKMKKTKRHAVFLLLLALAVCLKLVFSKNETSVPTVATKPTPGVSEPPTPAPRVEISATTKPALQLQAAVSVAVSPTREITPQPTAEPVIKNRNKVLCEHIISGETRYEFNGQIRLINKGSEPIYGWSVEWRYPDGSTLFDSAEVALAGNNPYRGEYLDSNAEIAPGKTVTFYFSGIKGGESSPININVTGDFCI
ncbi:MAG: cellulose-binding domain-containing protein [Cellvibrionaceae bacterium]|nr:cellulose-binding domain-containing protein [Cellvibrionaceae bacterium]